MNWWEFLEAHPMPNHAIQDLPDVEKIAHEEWERIRNICHLNNVDLHVDYDNDYFKNVTGVLATASRTMFLIHNEWQPGAINDYNIKGSIIIKMNPYVPNGWYESSNEEGSGNCNTGYRYDIRTVIRHELIHGIGISSSIQRYNIGYHYLNKCFLTSFDHHMTTMDGTDYLNGCTFSVTRTADAYVSGVKLYNPPDFQIGSSFSHVDSSGLMYYSIPPMQCYDYDNTIYSLLNEIGARCPNPNPVDNTHDKPLSDVNVNNTVTSGSVCRNVNFSVYIIVFFILKCLIARLRI